MSGLLTGVLLSRTFAGIVAQLAGWRGVYAMAAVAMTVTTVILYTLLPDLPPEIDASYGTQLRQTFALVRSQPILRWRSLMGACGFGTFSAFWTTVAFLLSRPPYDFNQLEIGLFALAGTAGALTAAFASKQIDARRGLRWTATGIVQAALLASFALIALGGAHPHPHWLGLVTLTCQVKLAGSPPRGSAGAGLMDPGTTDPSAGVLARRYRLPAAAAALTAGTRGIILRPGGEPVGRAEPDRAGALHRQPGTTGAVMIQMHAAHPAADRHSLPAVLQ